MILDETFHTNAVEVINTLRDTNIIKGLDLVLAEADKDKTLLRKLANLARNNNHKNLSEARIEKMKNIASALKLNLKIDGNQLVIEDKADMQLVLRMLDQYYLECMQTGEHFGSHAKKRLT